jgi:predicted PurR-regulated permease PerM
LARPNSYRDVSYLLAVAVWLERIHFPRVLAVSFVPVLFVAAMGLVGWTVANQLVDVTGQLPSYKENIQNKINLLRSPNGQRLNKATAAVMELSKELAAAEANDTAVGKTGASKTPSVRPLLVEVVSPPGNLLEYAGSVLDR